MKHFKPISSLDQARFDELFVELQAATDTFAGYPCNVNYDYSPLYRFLAFSLNNIGDPFAFSNYNVNTHQFEREVITFFAKLLKAGKAGRGYVSNGGTEGNLFGLDLGLQRFPDGIVYYSETAHYSIDKLTRIIRAPIEKIPALENGEIDYAILKERLEKNKHKPAIISLNIGTTMKGAVDDLEKIKTTLAELHIDRHHLHADAALSGMILPFVDEPQPFNFEDGIQSIAISGHKLIGSPLPCGIVMTNQAPSEASQSSIAYVKIKDSTISGSRNGFTPLILWYAIKGYGLEGFRHLVQDSLALADYAIEQFNQAGIPAWRNKNSLTVVFPRPAEHLIEKWQLAPHHDIAHVVIMPHFDKRFIDEILRDLKADASLP
jgi:histidine decarboxylase